MQVIVDGLLTSYERLGKGSKTVVILHGWGDAGKSFRQLSQELAKTHQVIIPDLPGFGGTASPPIAWGLNEYADFIQKFLSKLEVKTVYAFIGHSNGGAIAIRGLATSKLKADRLILLATAGIRGVYKGRMKALRYVVKAGKVLTTPLPKTLKKKLQRKVYHTVGSDMLVAEHLQDTFKKIVADDVRTDAASLDVTTLLIYGEKDEQTPLWYGEAFHKLIKHSSLEVLPRAEHFVHHDHPEKVTQLIQEFL